MVKEVDSRRAPRERARGKSKRGHASQAPRERAGGKSERAVVKGGRKQ